MVFPLKSQVPCGKTTDATERFFQAAAQAGCPPPKKLGFSASGGRLRGLFLRLVMEGEMRPMFEVGVACLPDSCFYQSSLFGCLCIAGSSTDFRQRAVFGSIRFGEDRERHRLFVSYGAVISASESSLHLALGQEAKMNGRVS